MRFLLNDLCSPRLMAAIRTARTADTKQHGHVTKGGKGSSATFIYLMYILLSFQRLRLISIELPPPRFLCKPIVRQVGLGIKIDPK